MASPLPLRMGRIGYLNVLPTYHALEAGILPHDFELVSGPPALLNEMMARGELHVSSCSCFEYATRPERYYLVDDLSIGSRGPVMSVLLLSRVPLMQLDGKNILVSGETHTSVALLRLLMRDFYHCNVTYSTGPVTPSLRSATPPDAFLAIGDLLRSARDWGLKHLDIILDLTGHGCPLSRKELTAYYTEGLVYTLGEEEKKGLLLFYEKLSQAGLIPTVPALEFFGM